LSEEKNEDLERLCGWAMRMVFIALFPLAVLIFVTSDYIILFAFGDGFVASAAMLRIACWSLVLFGFNRILSILLISYYKQGRLVRIRMMAYVGYFLLSILLVWKYSYLGLAWSKIITESALFLVTFYYAVKISPTVAMLKRFAWPAALCLLPTVGLVLGGCQPLPILGVFAVLFIATGTYFAVIRASDFKLLKPWLVKQFGLRASDDNNDLL
jgi:O-antigen/teichoic acid export membrane protein